MPIFGGITSSNVTTQAQSRLMNLRTAFEAVEDFYQWLSAYAPSDLVALGFSSADAQNIFNAFADAHEEYVLRTGGGLGTYTLPFNFMASQRVIIGPQY